MIKQACAAACHIFLVLGVLVCSFKMCTSMGEHLTTAGRSLSATSVRRNSSHDGDIDETKIIGGTTVTDRTMFPWMVYLVCEGGKCGGSLVSTSHVLTAAHCVLK